MALYRLDRMGLVAAGAGAKMMVGGGSGTIAIDKGSFMADRALALQSSGVFQKLVATAKSASTAPVDPQASADQQLQNLQNQLSTQQAAAAGAEAEDIGAPSTPWLLYAGLGVGAVALIGGAIFLTRKKGKAAKTAGYRRRRRGRR